jgi:hypothetical protein
MIEILKDSIPVAFSILTTYVPAASEETSRAVS